MVRSPIQGVVQNVSELTVFEFSSERGQRVYSVSTARLSGKYQVISCKSIGQEMYDRRMDNAFDGAHLVLSLLY
jgi:hypothetical protein